MSSGEESIWPLPPATGMQLTFLTEEDLEKIRKEESFTKDITSVHDVPLAASASNVIQTLKVMIRGPNGDSVPQEVFGRTVHRRAPHPSAGGQDGGGVVMTALTTTILYHGGVISDVHQDVLYAVIHLWEQRYHQTHDTSPTIGVTKPDIARIIGQQINGPLRKKIEEAISTLRGVEVIKVYHAASGLNEVIEVIGGFIQNYTTERAAANAHRPADMMMITLNSALVAALTGRSASREWALRPLNMTRLWKHAPGWKRSLYRQLDARLYRRGVFSMPLRELWVDVLGQDPVVAKNPTNWRDIRRRLKAFLVELEATGYISSYEFFTRRASDSMVAAELREALPEAPGFMEVKVNRSLSGITKMEVPMRDNEPLREWLECRPGPAFLEGQPKARVDFARDIANTICERPEQGESLLNRIGAESLVQLGYGHLRVLVRELEDRLDRLPICHWLRISTPIPALAHLERMYSIEANMRARARTVGDQVVSIPEFERIRVHAITPHFEEKVKAYCIANPKKSQYALPEDPLPSRISEQISIYAYENAEAVAKHLVMGPVIEAFKLVIDRLVSDRLISRDILIPHLRSGSVDLERVWNKLADEALPLAIKIAGVSRWSEEFARRIETYFDAKPGSVLTSPYYVAAAKRFPASAQLVANMTGSTAAVWEREIGYRFARRMTERYLEERQIVTRKSTAVGAAKVVTGEDADAVEGDLGPAETDG
jgi:hypothetical protein